MIQNNNTEIPQKGLFYNAMGLAFVLIFLFLFQLLFYFLAVAGAAMFYGMSFSSVQQLISAPDGTAVAINIARFTNAVSFTGYMLLPALLFTVINRTSVAWEGGLKKPVYRGALLTSILIVALCLPLVDYFTAQMNFIDWPQWMRFWANKFESSRSELMETMLDMQNPVELLGCILLLAVMPAFFEELMFRGILLNIFTKMSYSKVTAVFLQALVFGALHFSFYEFPGILLMGIIFGWIAMKSGTIWYGIIMHFIFNATAVVMSYINQRSFEKTGISDTYENITLSVPLAIAAFAGVILLLRLFSKTIYTENNGAE